MKLGPGLYEFKSRDSFSVLAQTPEKTVIIYSGIEAAKIWHFCAKELENIVTNFDALITTDPTSGTPNSLTIEAEKKFEKNIRKRLREVKERLLSLQEGKLDLLMSYLPLCRRT